MINWGDQLLTGVKPIDEQHRFLFTIVNEFLDKRDGPTASKVFLKLLKYARDHFVDEEKLMRESVYPGIEEHRQQHQVLMEQLNNFDISEFDTLAGRKEFRRFCLDWLCEHIRGEDQDFVNHYRTIGQR